MVPVKGEVGRDVRSASPILDSVLDRVPDRVPDWASDPQDPGPHRFSHATYQKRKEGKPHPVEAHGVSNLTLKGCTGFPAALGAPGVSRSSDPLLEGCTCSSTQCYREDLLPHVPGTSQFVSLFSIFFPPPPSTPT